MNEPSYSSEKEINFKQQFVASFLAAWCANHYDDYCMRNLHKELESPPVEDADFLAGTAWETYKKVNGV